MSDTVLVAAFSSVSTLGALFLTYYLTRKREQEGDIRKTKFEHYKEFVVALSGVTQGRADDSAQRRYADAVNSLVLVASAQVLRCVYDFQNEISYKNLKRDFKKEDKLLREIVVAMRVDVRLARSADSRLTEIKLMAVPPQRADADPST